MKFYIPESDPLQKGLIFVQGISLHGRSIRRDRPIPRIDQEVSGGGCRGGLVPEILLQVNMGCFGKQSAGGAVPVRPGKSDLTDTFEGVRLQNEQAIFM